MSGPKDAAGIAQRASRGGVLYVSRSLVVQLMQVGSTLAVAHHVSPSAFGLVTLSLAIVGSMRLFGDLGILYQLSIKASVSDEDERSGMLVAVVSSSTFFLVSLLVGFVAMPQAPGTHLSQLVLPALAITLPTEALRQTAMLRLQRSMSFSRIGIINIIEAVVLYAVQIALVLVGFGVWGLVFAHLVARVVGTVLLTRFGRVLARPSGAGNVSDLLRASLPFQVPNLVSAALGIVAPILVLLALSQEDLGFWGWSTILMTPVIGITIAVHQISSPTLARLRRVDDSRSDEATDLMLRLMVLFAALASGGLFGIAPELVRLVFGQTWVPATDAVRVSLVAVVPFAAGVLLASSIEVQGLVHTRVRATIVAGLCTVLLVYPLALVFGVAGAAVATALLLPTIECVLLGIKMKIRLHRAGLNAVVGWACAASVSSLAAQYATSLGSLLVALCVMGGALPVLGLLTDGKVIVRAVGVLRQSPKTS